ncbi:MAG: hypothetical protein NZ827_00705 [Aquificaceae bacterium]|nr:hypothetical protein [Aquificaceae bacterium]MCS7195776.1 hypothetical protein [Aquificaceae bacterium]MDW8295133.1 hypothetical protein [Aquificaceae bacterium]
MVKALFFVLSGFLLGVGFVGLTHRLAGRGLVGLYLLSLPAKLSIWAFAFLACYFGGGFIGFLLCISAFLLGFLSTLLFIGFRKDGRAEGL